MRINQLSHTTDVGNYVKINSNGSINNKHNNVNFQKTPITYKNALVMAPLVLSLFGAVVPASAKAETGGLHGTEIVGNKSDEGVIRYDIGKYFVENGFTPEQRVVIADSAIEYSTKHFDNFINNCTDAYVECGYFNDDESDIPENSFGLHSDFYMKKYEKGAKDLTEFMHKMIKLDAVENDNLHALNLINDNKEAIEEILGKDVTVEQYMKDNKATIAKLDNIKIEDAVTLTEDEINVYINVRDLLQIFDGYLTGAGEYLKQKAIFGIGEKVSQYYNDMEKLNEFRNETDNAKNIFLSLTQEGKIEITNFEYPATSKGFGDAIINLYNKNHPDRVADISGTKTKSLIYDLSGHVVSDSSRPGIYIKNDKKIAVK